MDNLWWGYLHTNNNIQVKRYFDKQDLEEAESSPFVRKVYQPFPANNRAEAIEYLKRLTT